MRRNCFPPKKEWRLLVKRKWNLMPSWFRSLQRHIFSIWWHLQQNRFIPPNSTSTATSSTTTTSTNTTPASPTKQVHSEFLRQDSCMAWQRKAGGRQEKERFDAKKVRGSGWMIWVPDLLTFHRLKGAQNLNGWRLHQNKIFSVFHNLLRSNMTTFDCQYPVNPIQSFVNTARWKS